MQLQIVSYPNMKKDGRNKLFKQLKKAAKISNKPVSSEEFANIIKGMIDGR